MSTSNLKRSVLLPRDQVQNPESLMGRLAARLGPNELRRRIWHMSPGLLPFILWAIPHADPMSPTLRGILILASLGLGIGIFAKYRQIQREEDHGRLMSVIGYAGSVLAMLMLFPADLELGLTLLAILAFGDGAAQGEVQGEAGRGGGARRLRSGARPAVHGRGAHAELQGARGGRALRQARYLVSVDLARRLDRKSGA